MLAITGDFTQRARREQFQSASEFLERARLHVTQIVACPGNHDIPLYRAWERILRPFDLYRRYIDQRLEPIIDGDDMRIVALNSVKPFSHLVDGHLGEKQYEKAASAFTYLPLSHFRLICLHHPPSRDQLAGSLERKLRFQKFCEENRIDLVLTGHDHESEARLLMSETSDLAGGTIHVSCGTSTSRRGRRSEMGKNSFQWIESRGSMIEVTTFLYETSALGFIADRRKQFSRRDSFG